MEFDGRYDLPSRKYFTHTSIPALYTKVRSIPLNLSYSKHMQFYSATTDLWSSVGLLPYMSYTVHFTYSSWELQTRCLETLLPQDHTGVNIAEAAKSTPVAWKLSEDKQVCLTTDNGIAT